MAENIHEHLELSLHMVATAPYTSLHIVDREYPHWILSHVLHGNGETHCRGEVWHIGDGDVMLHPPYLPFSELSDGAGVHQWLLLDIVGEHHIDLFRRYPVSPVVSLPPEYNFSSMFQDLERIWSDDTCFLRDLRATALATQLCAMVLEAWSRTGSIPRSQALQTPQDRFIDVIKYMDEHLEQKLSREDLAAMVYLHPGYFDRVFHTIYGVAPMQMLRDLRLRRAQHLLESTDLPLSAIALQCGLGDAGYFSRVFRQRYSQAPGQYRQGVKSAMTGYLSPL